MTAKATPPPTRSSRGRSTGRTEAQLRTSKRSTRPMGTLISNVQCQPVRSTIIPPPRGHRWPRRARCGRPPTERLFLGENYFGNDPHLIHSIKSAADADLKKLDQSSRLAIQHERTLEEIGDVDRQDSSAAHVPAMSASKATVVPMSDRQRRGVGRRI